MVKLLAAKSLLSIDGWKNVLSGLGVFARDKRESAVPTIDLLDYQDLTTFYRGNDLAGRIVNLPADEMTREWLDVKVEGDEELAEEIGAVLDDLEVPCYINQAMRWRRLYGGGIILLGADDGQTLDMPLDENRIRSIDWLTPFDPIECQALSFYENPAAKNYGKVEFYQITPQFTMPVASLNRVHESRVLRFSAPLANRRQLFENNGVSQGWGDSVLVRIVKLIRDYDGAWNGVAHVMQDFAQSVFKMQGLSNALLADNSNAIITRMQLIDMSRSVARAVLLDKDNEDFIRQTTPLTGIPETLEKFMVRVAAAAELPVTLLFGQSATGMNATGANDARMFYDMIKAAQVRDMKPQLERLIKLLMLAKTGPTGGKEVDSWSIQFRPLWQMSELEKAEIKFKMSQTDQAYLNMGVLSTEDIAESRFGGDEYSIETSIDMDEVASRAGEEQAKADQAAEQNSQMHEATVASMTTKGE